MSFFSKTCDPCHVALCVRNSLALLLNLTEFTRLRCHVFFVCGCATSKWSDVLFWETIRLKSHKIIPKSIQCKEYIDVSNCPTWILLRIHAKLKHRLDRFVRNHDAHWSMEIYVTDCVPDWSMSNVTTPELLAHSTRLPVSWLKHRPTCDPNGRVINN